MSATTKKIYFASDFHLGSPNLEESHKREKKIVSWLNHIEKDAAEIFLVGDIFDFWFEYKRAIPRGFVRLQGKIAELTEKISFIFLLETRMWILTTSKRIRYSSFTNSKQLKYDLIGHGDGLDLEKGVQFIRIFSSKFCQWCFADTPKRNLVADRSSKKSVQ